MHTKKSLMADLEKIGIKPEGTLKIHISYKAIGDVEGRGDTVLDALMEYMKPGLLVLASHTWDSVNSENPIMDVLHTPTCVGILTEMFRKREGVHRSLHPTHSVAAYGKDAEKFVADDVKLTTPCGEGGSYYKLWERDAQILMIGCNYSSNTFVHGIEEWDKAHDTISSESEDYYVINHMGERLYTPQYRHCAPLGSSTFTKIEPYAFEKGLLAFGKFGDADTRLMTAKDLRSLVAEFLQEDNKFLSGY